MVKVLYCKLPTIGKELPTFPHKDWGLNRRPQVGVECVTTEPLDRSGNQHQRETLQRHCGFQSTLVGPVVDDEDDTLDDIPLSELKFFYDVFGADFAELLNFFFIYLFGVLRHFQHCTGHITTGTW